jgi:hypothetical protein
MRKRSKLNISNFHNSTFKMGYLYPCNCFEVLPGDTIQMSTSVFLRMAPMVAPVMHPTYMFIHSYFVPSRVIANQLREDGGADFDFESFITGGPDGTDAQTIPKLVLNKTNAPVGSLPDAFGIPVQNLSDSGTLSVNMLPFVAYFMIWNEYYRDQTLQDPIDFSIWTDGWTRSDAWVLHQPCWSKDYFTTATPNPQLGPQVTIPVNLTSSGGDPLITAQTTLSGGSISGNGAPTYNIGSPVQAQFNSTGNRLISYLGGDSGGASWNNPALTLNNPTATTNVTWNGGPDTQGNINVSDVREAFAIQRFEEHRALYGARYDDYLRFLGVRPQDARLQLPEYLGGFSAPVQFSEVLQTSAGEHGGVGDLYGHGIGAGRSRRIRRFIPEHGYVISLICVRPISVYSQGLERMWSKTNRLDIWQKELEHIGQQEVLNSEVYANGATEDGNTFGFQNRYDEYRRGVNIITGEFRTNQNFWTLAREFANRPALNGSFVQCNPSDRIFQVGEQNSDQCYAMIKNNIIARRLISRNGNPI